MRVRPPCAVGSADPLWTRVVRTVVYVSGFRQGASKRNVLVFLLYLVCVVTVLGATGVL